MLMIGIQRTTQIFQINDGQPLESTVSGSTPDGEQVVIDFKSGGKDGVAHRAQDILQINATGTVDLGPLNLRLSAVVDNNTYESNSLPIYYMFNTERLPKSERKLSMYNARANYFLNPNLLLTAGVSTFTRTFESYDDGMGKPGGFGDALAYYDSASVAAKGIDASWWAGGNTNFATPGATYISPAPYYVANTFAFSRPATTTISPASPISIGTFFVPSYLKILVSLPSSTFSPFRFIAFID